MFDRFQVYSLKYCPGSGELRGHNTENSKSGGWGIRIMSFKEGTIEGRFSSIKRIRLNIYTY